MNNNNIQKDIDIQLNSTRCVNANQKRADVATYSIWKWSNFLNIRFKEIYKILFYGKALIRTFENFKDMSTFLVFSRINYIIIIYFLFIQSIQGDAVNLLKCALKILMKTSCTEFHFIFRLIYGRKFLYEHIQYNI